MNRFSVAEIAKAVADKHGIALNRAEDFVAECFNVIADGLHADKAVKVRGLGTFKVVDVRERESVNVNTGERVTIESHGKISFTPDPIMRDLVNKPFAKFETVVLNEGVNIDELNKIGGEMNGEETAEEADYEPDQTEIFEAKPAMESEKEESLVPETPTPALDKPNMEEIEMPAAGQETTIAEPKNIEKGQEEQAPDDEAEDEQEKAKRDFEDEEPSFATRHKTSLAVAVALLIAATAFAGGYLLGQRMSSRPVVKTIKVYNIVRPKTNIKAEKDTCANKVAATTEKQGAMRKETSTDAKEQAVAEPDKVAESASPAISLAQRQVKTGAYYIIGTERTITVRKGQTLKKISKANLGEGMECYIQVHNGIEDVKEGMKLKIPKLKLKKR